MIINSYRFGVSISYATWDPANKTAGFTLSGSNLIASESTGNLEAITTTASKTAGKWYVEVLIAGSGTNYDNTLGMRRIDESINTAFNLGQTIVARSNGTTFVGSSGASAGTPTSWTSGTRLMVAFDMDEQRVWVGRNGVWMNSGNPAAGTGALFTGFTVGPGWEVFFGTDNGPYNHVGTLNCGQSAFAYTVPSGFSGLA